MTSPPSVEPTAPPPAALPPPLRRPPGILCPACAVKTFMRRTQARRDNSVRRTRECPQCGRRLVTFERVRADPPPAA